MITSAIPPFKKAATRLLKTVSSTTKQGDKPVWHRKHKETYACTRPSDFANKIPRGTERERLDKYDHPKELEVVKAAQTMCSYKGPL